MITRGRRLRLGALLRVRWTFLLWFGRAPALRRGGLNHGLVGNDVTLRCKCNSADFLRVGGLDGCVYRCPVLFPFEKRAPQQNEQENGGAGSGGSFSREE